MNVGSAYHGGGVHGRTSKPIDMFYEFTRVRLRTCLEVRLRKCCLGNAMANGSFAVLSMHLESKAGTEDDGTQSTGGRVGGGESRAGSPWLGKK